MLYYNYNDNGLLVSDPHIKAVPCLLLREWLVYLQHYLAGKYDQKLSITIDACQQIPSDWEHTEAYMYSIANWFVQTAYLLLPTDRVFPVIIDHESAAAARSLVVPLNWKTSPKVYDYIYHFLKATMDIKETQINSLAALQSHFVQHLSENIFRDLWPSLLDHIFEMVTQYAEYLYGK